MEYKEKMEYKETTLMEFWRRHGVSDKGRRQLVGGCILSILVGGAATGRGGRFKGHFKHTH
jgi:hypothetical protein